MQCKKQCFIQIHVPIFDVHLRRFALLFFSQVRSPDLHHKSFFGDQLHGPGGSGLRILSGSSCIKSAPGGALQDVFHDAARGTKLVTPITLSGPGPRETVFLTAISLSHFLDPLRVGSRFLAGLLPGSGPAWAGLGRPGPGRPGPASRSDFLWISFDFPLSLFL